MRVVEGGRGERGVGRMAVVEMVRVMKDSEWRRREDSVFVRALLPYAYRSALTACVRRRRTGQKRGMPRLG